eukprot:232936-Pelagomonas_calceolata.AAC.2
MAKAQPGHICCCLISLYHSCKLGHSSLNLVFVRFSQSYKGNSNEEALMKKTFSGSSSSEPQGKVYGNAKHGVLWVAFRPPHPSTSCPSS